MLYYGLFGGPYLNRQVQKGLLEHMQQSCPPEYQQAMTPDFRASTFRPSYSKANIFTDIGHTTNSTRLQEIAPRRRLPQRAQPAECIRQVRWSVENHQQRCRDDAGCVPSCLSPFQNASLTFDFDHRRRNSNRCHHLRDRLRSCKFLNVGLHKYNTRVDLLVHRKSFHSTSAASMG